MTLSKARRKRDEAKGELDDGINPAEVKRQKRLEAELAAKAAFALVADTPVMKHGFSLNVEFSKAGNESVLPIRSASFRVPRTGPLIFRCAQEWLYWESGDVVAAVFDNLLLDDDDTRRRVAGCDQLSLG